ncbi:MAG: hypothetical protein JSU72_16070 [Deltaproteobacteria bacterium]|nr:MAG: hypothetical protein JSU72_16070 [Deltaproteobacteria bacterium]
MNLNKIYCLFFLPAFMFFSVWGTGDAEASDFRSRLLRHKIAGTYLLVEANEGGSRIVTLTADGRWFGTHSLQFEYKFSDQQGSWERVGKRKIKAKALDFYFSDEGVGMSRFMFTVEFDRRCQNVTGKLIGETFAPGVDPLDPDAVPIIKFENTFTGKRLTVSDDIPFDPDED